MVAVSWMRLSAVTAPMHAVLGRPQREVVLIISLMSSKSWGVLSRLGQCSCAQLI